MRSLPVDLERRSEFIEGEDKSDAQIQKVGVAVAVLESKFKILMETVHTERIVDETGPRGNTILAGAVGDDLLLQFGHKDFCDESGNRSPHRKSIWEAVEYSQVLVQIDFK